MQQSNNFIFDVTEQLFEQSVLQASCQVPVLVDFWAQWCPPCLALTPVLERVVGKFNGQLLLAKLEVDDNMRLAGRYRLRGFPTVIAFVDGIETARFSSVRSEAWLIDFIESNALAGPRAG